MISRRLRPARLRGLGLLSVAALILAWATPQVSARQAPGGAPDPTKAKAQAAPGTLGKTNLAPAVPAQPSTPDAHATPEPGQATAPRTMIDDFIFNFSHNLFKPLLLFFYLGFLVPILKVDFEFPKPVYQGLVIYLLVAIGFEGGEKLAGLKREALGGAVGFMALGFLLNFVIGVVSYLALRAATKIRHVDQATVAGYYGSDSAGTFATCVGALGTAHIAFDGYMPVMLAVMEIPGCLVALYLVSRLREKGMDALGNMPDEPGYDPKAARPVDWENEGHEHDHSPASHADNVTHVGAASPHADRKPTRIFNTKLLHEVFLNPGLFLLFGGILIGFAGGVQGEAVVGPPNQFFHNLFQGVLCLFLLEMGMTASSKLRDLKTAGIGYIAFGLIAPNVFATTGIVAAHVYSLVTGVHLMLGSYVLFAVLCGAASYIAVPAVQRLAIPEASPTLPLAASLGLTFSYNVTIGIPVYIIISQVLMKQFPAG